MTRERRLDFEMIGLVRVYGVAVHVCESRKLTSIMMVSICGEEKRIERVRDIGRREGRG